MSVEKPISVKGFLDVLANNVKQQLMIARLHLKKRFKEG